MSTRQSRCGSPAFLPEDWLRMQISRQYYSGNSVGSSRAVLTHPISGRKALYANPGYTMRINELPEDESDRLLERLFAHQSQDKYRYIFRWQAGDVLVWDNLRTIHQAVADYGPNEHRLIKRCQVMATRFFPAHA